MADLSILAFLIHFILASTNRKADIVWLNKLFLDGLGVGTETQDRRISYSKNSTFLSLDGSNIDLNHIPNEAYQRTHLLEKDIPICFSLQVAAETLGENFENLTQPQNLFQRYPRVDLENLAFRLFSDISWKLVMPELSQFTVKHASFDLDALEAIIVLGATKMAKVRLVYPFATTWIRALIDVILTEVINIAY